MKSLINRLEQLPEPKRTYLEILKVHQKEVPIANLLAFFFRPKEKHGLNNLFIEALLNTECYSLDNKGSMKNVSDNSYSNEGKMKLDYSNLNDIEVEVEFPVKEKMDKDSSNGNKRIDILIIAKNFVICIEFKINHDLDNPLEVYQNYIEENHPNKQHVFLVLTPSEKKAIGPAKKYIEENNSPPKEIKFKQVILSHFFKKLALATDSIDNYTSYYSDFVQTIKNREIRYRRSELLNKIATRIQHDLKCEQINNINGGYLQFHVDGFIIKLRIEMKQFKLEKCNSEFKIIKPAEQLKFTSDIHLIKKTILEI